MVVLLLLGNACSSTADGPMPPPAPPVAYRCPHDPALLGIPTVVTKRSWPEGSIPGGFAATEVMECAVHGLASRNDGQGVRFRVDQLVAPAPGPLLAALSLPDRVDRRATCSAVYHLPLLILLKSQRGAVRVHIPVDPCGLPRPEVTEALSTLHFEVRSSFALTVKLGGGRT